MDVVDILYAKNKFGGSGGSNPNRVQVITGTLAEPFGDVVGLSGELYYGNASAKIRATLGELSVDMPLTATTVSGGAIYLYMIAMYSEMLSAISEYIAII